MKGSARPRWDLRDVNRAKPNAAVEGSSPQTKKERKPNSSGPLPIVNGYDWLEVGLYIPSMGSPQTEKRT